jgi:hypothetical protein
VNGGVVAGVLVVTAILAEVSKKFPANFSAVLEKDKKDWVTPLHSIRSDFTKAPTNPKACAISKLFGTVKTSCTVQMFSKWRTALPASKSIATASFGIWMVQKSSVGEIPGSYECGPNPTGAPRLSIHMNAKAPWCFLSSDPMNTPFINRVSVWKLNVPVVPVLVSVPVPLKLRSA